jgi:hypothetical protein
MRYVVAFGRFWYGFLIGDRPELFIGPIFGLAIVAGLTQLGWATAGGLLLFGLVIASGGWGLLSDLAEARVGGSR